MDLGESGRRRDSLPLSIMGPWLLPKAIRQPFTRTLTVILSYILGKSPRTKLMLETFLYGFTDLGVLSEQSFRKYYVFKYDQKRDSGISSGSWNLLTHSMGEFK